MEDITPLFTEISPEESATVSGGIRISFDLNTYMFILGAGILFGNPGLTKDEIQFAWESAFIFEDAPSSRRVRHSRRRRNYYF